MTDDGLAPLPGFTLIELLVSLAIVLIVLVAAVPALSALMARNKLTSAVNSFVATLAAARSLALTGRGPATLCSNDGGACGSADQWAAGVLLFADADSSQTLNGTEAVARGQDPVADLTVTSNVAAVTFRQDGSATSAARWLFCDPGRRTEPRIIALQVTGSHSILTPDSCAL